MQSAPRQRSFTFIPPRIRRRRFSLPSSLAVGVLVSLFLRPALVSAAPGPDAAAAHASPAPLPLGEIANLSLEKLMDIEVVTVSKRTEKLIDSAAATFVLTNDDIRRSGANSIPEALRLVPGLDVAQVDASRWAISSRGFNGQFANKLLVLIDGRTVYTPFFSGVIWIDQDLMLEDVDRIEVVRGPGGTLWGANAVNGIINIITKSARETQGTLASIGGGTEDRLTTAVRHGGTAGENGFWRAYAKYQQQDNAKFSDGSDAHDSWERFKTGARIDTALSADTTATVIGDWGFLSQGETLEIPLRSDALVEESQRGQHSTEGDVIGRLQSNLSADSQVQVQVSYERVNKTDVVPLRENILDLDLQHSYRFTDRNRLTYGAGYRLNTTKTASVGFITFDPESRRRSVYSWFLSDEIDLAPKTLVLTLGSKFEYNELTNMEAQPSIRLRYSPSELHTVWGAVTRAIHTPSVVDEDIKLDLIPSRDPQTGLVAVPQLLGSADVRADSMVAYELGYRTRMIPYSALDIAAFFNSYNNLASRVPGEPVLAQGTGGTPVAIIPLSLQNKGDTSFWGGELIDTVTLTDTWRLSGWYSFLRETRDSETADLNQAPHNQFGIRSSHDLAPGWEADLYLRYTERLQDLHIPSVVDGTARLSWKYDEHLRLSLVGQHLIEDHHLEFSSEFLQIRRSEVQRGIYANATYTF